MPQKLTSTPLKLWNIEGSKSPIITLNAIRLPIKRPIILGNKSYIFCQLINWNNGKIKTINSFRLSWLIHQRRQYGDVNKSYTPCLLLQISWPQSKTDHTMYWSLYWFPFFFLTAYAKYIIHGEEVSNVISWTTMYGRVVNQTQHHLNPLSPNINI